MNTSQCKVKLPKEKTVEPFNVNVKKCKDLLKKSEDSIMWLVLALSWNCHNHWTSHQHTEQGDLFMRRRNLPLKVKKVRLLLQICISNHPDICSDYYRNLLYKIEKETRAHYFHKTHTIFHSCQLVTHSESYWLNHHFSIILHCWHQCPKELRQNRCLVSPVKLLCF